MVVDKIIKNNEFYMKIEPRLTKFYMECLLPELIDSMFDRGLPLGRAHIETQVTQRSVGKTALPK